jgi:hypothetical protein
MVEFMEGGSLSMRSMMGRPLSKGYGVPHPMARESLFDDGRVSTDEPLVGPVRVSSERAPGTSRVASCRLQAVVHL